MSAELIAVIVALLGAWVDRARKESRLADLCEHAIKQNSELLGRQTNILERVVSIQESLVLRVETLEEASEAEDVIVVGFRPEDDDAEEEEAEAAEEDEPVKNAGRGRARSRHTSRS